MDIVNAFCVGYTIVSIPLNIMGIGYMVWRLTR